LYKLHIVDKLRFISLLASVPILCSRSVCCVIYRLAQNSLPSLASGLIRSQWALWLRLLPHTNIAWNARCRVPNMATDRQPARADHPTISRRWAATQKSGPDIQWSGPIPPAHTGYGKSASAAWCYNAEFW